MILQRLRSAGELPSALRTSLGIQLAPALVACSAWFSVNGGEADTFAKMLFGYGLLQLLFMLRLMPWFLSQPFNASFWSFSFGVSALATTGLHLGQSSPSGFFHAIGQFFRRMRRVQAANGIQERRMQFIRIWSIWRHLIRIMY